MLFWLAIKIDWSFSKTPINWFRVTQFLQQLGLCIFTLEWFHHRALTPKMSALLGWSILSLLIMMCGNAVAGKYWKEARNTLDESYVACRVTPRKPTANEDYPNDLDFYAVKEVRKPLWKNGMGVRYFEAIFVCRWPSDHQTTTLWKMSPSTHLKNTSTLQSLKWSHFIHWSSPKSFRLWKINGWVKALISGAVLVVTLVQMGGINRSNLLVRIESGRINWSKLLSRNDFGRKW